MSELLYNDFCRESGCDQYIEWDFEWESGSQPYQCTSCMKVGQSYEIDKYPEDCDFLEEIKAFEHQNKQE